MATVEEKLAKLEAETEARRAALVEEQARIAQVAQFNARLVELRATKAKLQAEIDSVKKERDALVPHRPRKVAP